LADSGIEVHLAEISPFIGSSPSANVPEHLLNARALEIAKHPCVTLWMNTHLHLAEGNGDHFQIQLHRYPRFVNLNTCTGCGECVDVCPVTVPDTQHSAIYCLNGAQPQCAVIDKTGIAPCSGACPAGIRVQGYVALIADGRFQEAIDLVREDIPFPGICGRVCTHPCEADCRRNEIDQPLAIRQLKRFIADWALRNKGGAQPKAMLQRRPDSNNKRVAIVGAGPAGLTAAYFLVQQGYSATVFEKLPVAGGMMAVGIPSFRLPRDILNLEIDALVEMGIEIKTGVTFGSDITLEGLKADGFQAVFLATGLHGSRKLGVAGEKLRGVHDGVAFLKNVALGKEVNLGHKIIVVGGGNVAMDVALTARRLGCDEVTIVCLETREEMPAWQFEIEEALEAGVEILNCFGPNRFVEKDGRFAGIEFKRCTCVFDDQCNFNPQYDETDLNTLEAQNVVIAIGQAAVQDTAVSKQVVCSPQGEIIADPVTLQTNLSWVFAGGDAVHGPKSVVEAIASGKQAAASIHRFLCGHDFNSNDSPGSARDQKPISQRPLSDAQRLPQARVSVPVLPLQETLSGFCEVELGYSEAQALKEARRCLVCGPCSECMACVEACRPLAIDHEQQATVVELEAGAIIYADDQQRFDQLPLTADDRIYVVQPEDLMLGSATAARIMHNWRAGPYVQSLARTAGSTVGSTRIGVFICRCGEAIAQTVDVEAVRRQTAGLGGVICVEILPFSCTSEAGNTIAEIQSSLDLTHVVLAACACCALDQVCYSCTYQRVRCKQNLEIVNLPGFTRQPPDLSAAGNGRPVMMEFVNIREQCAWVHPDDPPAATAKAAALISAAVAKMRMAALKSIETRAFERSVLIAGSGEAAFACRDHIKNRDIIVKQTDGRASRIWRTNGSYALRYNEQTWTAESIVLAPCEPAEADSLISAFGSYSRRPRIQTTWGGLETNLPGVFYCEPQADGLLAGAAAAARVSAWLGRCRATVKSNTAVVDVYRCRACQTCIDICEFGAPQIVGQEPDHNVWVDPCICAGCGTCAAHCPSGAISAGYSSDEQLTVMVEAILADEEKRDEDR
jgi:NADPH-dependent glutamate synthase beta subunit-like oxidoreductase/Pyruvate/2-oxoacid:ferredoxin oxidoreductase delta subunit